MQKIKRADPLTVSFEAPGHPPAVVTFKGRTAAGIRDVARLRAISEDEAAALLLRRGVEIVEARPPAPDFVAVPFGGMIGRPR